MISEYDMAYLEKSNKAFESPPVLKGKQCWICPAYFKNAFSSGLMEEAFVFRACRFFSPFQDAQGAEEREALARMAANVEDAASADSEAYIEKYLRSVLAVENILTLDRLRQVWF